jgi:hypothetical protein
MKARTLRFETCEDRRLLAGMETIDLGGIEIPLDETEVAEVAEGMVENMPTIRSKVIRDLDVNTRVSANRLIREFQDRRHADFHDDPERVAAVIDPGLNDIIRAGLNDPGFAANTDGDLEEGDLEAGLTAAAKMDRILARAVFKTRVGRDGDISPEDLFAVTEFIHRRFVTKDGNGDPVRVDGDGVPQDRDPNLTDVYYLGRWGQKHGDDAGGRREYGLTGDNVEHGYHLIQNDGGTTTLDGKPGNYTLNPAGGDGENLWTTVADGIYHIGNDIVYENDDGDLVFAEGYEDGVDYYFLNEDGDRNASLQDVSDWMDHFFQEDMETEALYSGYRLQEGVRALAFSERDWTVDNTDDEEVKRRRRGRGHHHDGRWGHRGGRCGRHR